MVFGLSKALISLFVDYAQCTAAKDNGFGSKYVWANDLESGLRIGKHHKKPVMLIIHKSWCTACKKLAPQFADSKDIQKLSRKFVMVNCMDEDEPDKPDYAPDGTYIPRILFINAKGEVDKDIYNEDGSSQYKYYYSKPEQIVKSMNKTLEKAEQEKEMEKQKELEKQEQEREKEKAQNKKKK